MPDREGALERQFTQELLKNCELSSAVCRQDRMLAELQKYGAVAYAKNLLRRNRRSEGFAALMAAGRLELSLEALVTAGKYGALFADEEVNACFSALCSAGYYRLSQ